MNGSTARAHRRAARVIAKETLGSSVLADIAIERRRQDERWGVHNHPLGCGPDKVTPEMVVEIRAACEEAFKTGKGTWRHILMEEVMEAMGESNLSALRKELVQVSAVAVAMAECIDRTMAQGKWFDGTSGVVAKPEPAEAEAA